MSDDTTIPRPTAPVRPGRPRYVIEGREYPFVDPGDVDMWVFPDIYDETGITAERLEQLQTEIADAGQEWSTFPTSTAWMSSREHVSAIAIQMWLARRAVGETLTIREAGMVPMSAWSIVTDSPEEEETEEADPPTPADGGGDAGPDDDSQE